MKNRILFLLSAVLLVGSCGVLTETRQERQEREAREALWVAEHVPAGDFTVTIDRMYPLRGTSRTVTSYSVRVHDGVLESYLPYIGQAWRVPYGGGHALNFTADIGNYVVSQTKKDAYEVQLYVKTDEDEHIYLFTIFDNGRVSLDVQSGNRERISYSGLISFPEE